MVTLAVWVDEPRVAVIVSTVGVATPTVVSLKDTDFALAGTITVAG